MNLVGELLEPRCQIRETQGRSKTATSEGKTTWVCLQH